MRRSLTLAVLSILCLLAAFSWAREEKHFLYMASPDAAQSEGKSGNGVLIFDIDAGHKFVRRIEIPSFEEGIRGFCANAATGRAWYTTTGRLLTDDVPVPDLLEERAPHQFMVRAVP